MNKFNVHELIILQSESEPSKNGEYYVNDVKLSPKCRINGPDGEVLENVYIYTLDGVEAKSGWLESALRKRHTGSEFSFSELLDNLKTKIQEGC